MTVKGPAETTENPATESEEAATSVTTDEGVEGEGGFLSSLFNLGAENKPFVATDYSDTYAAKKDYYLRFTHLPSALTLSFKAFVTSFEDSFTSNWTPTSVYGRMDDIQTFQNTTRQLSVGFVVPAFDADDARCNLAKVSSLMRKLYPYYSGDNPDNVSTISRSPLMRVRFANLIRNGATGVGGGLLGKVNGFTFSPVLEEGFFDYVGILYPKAINISFTFDVLHEHIMGWTDGPDDDGVQWADGLGSGFAYATPRETDTGAFADLASVPAEEDEAADIEEVLAIERINFK